MQKRICISLFGKNQEAKKMRVFLEDVPERYAFLLKDGKKLLSIEDLAKALRKMEHDVFHHHVTPDRHDFHNWVRDIILDLELAEKILNAKTKDDALKVVEERIKFIKSKIKPARKAAVKKAAAKKKPAAAKNARKKPAAKRGKKK